MHITFRLSVTVTLPLTTDPDHPDFYTKDQATAPEFQRRLEKKLYTLLGPMDGDCDCELLDYDIDESHDADCDCADCQVSRLEANRG